MRGHAWIVMLFSLLFTLVSAGFVHADSPNYDIIKVEMNEVDLEGSQVDVQRGERLDFRVTVESTENASFVPDVRVQVSIEGYEHGIISAISDIFSVDGGADRRRFVKTMTVYVPEDIDSSEVYTLRVEAADSQDEEQREYDLHIDEPRHNLRLFDVLFNPSSTIGAGQPLFVTARIENLGEKIEEDIRVTASVSSLGIQASNYLGRLITELEEQDEKFSFQDRSSAQIDLLLRIPEDAVSGSYQVEIAVDYNDGYNVLTETRTITVVGKPPASEVETVLNAESTTKRAAVGEEVTYRLMIANLGSEKGIYSIQLDGTSPWAEAWVEPGFLTVLPDSTGEVLIHLTPTVDAEARDYVFSGRVLVDGQVTNEILMHTIVQGEADYESTPVTFKTVLALIFGILVLVLIVLGLILAFRGHAEEDGEAEEEQQKGSRRKSYY